MSRFKRLLGAGAIAGALLLATNPASALPPGGAAADTPGTSASVSPRTLAPCQTLSFTVSGFPPGETVYVKIDDGAGQGDQTVQGSGVIHTQGIPASGTVNGSFELPCSIAPGSHWLRFLASAPAPGGNGILGYTKAGGTDFTVTAAGRSSTGSGSSPGGSSSGGSSSGGSGTGSTGGSGSAGTNAGNGATTSGSADGGAGNAADQATGNESGQQVAAEGELLVIPAPSGSATPSGSVDDSASSQTPGAVAGADSGGATVYAATVAAAQSSGPEGPPWIGIGGAVILVGSAGLFSWSTLRRSSSAGSTPAP